ncbi:hypothetical protein [Streptomyces sp. NPDC051218]|uniref:hypothetical protein n=1 Tax=Streptomyces sp. NPDC051218 TaxID=3365645 RepID=UPI0037A1EAC6
MSDHAPDTIRQLLSEHPDDLARLRVMTDELDDRYAGRRAPVLSPAQYTAWESARPVADRQAHGRGEQPQLTGAWFRQALGLYAVHLQRQLEWNGDL